MHLPFKWFFLSMIKIRERKQEEITTGLDPFSTNVTWKAQNQKLKKQYLFYS